MLSTIAIFRGNYSKGLIATAEVDYILGLLYNTCEDYEKALDYARKAFEGLCPLLTF
jgi:hypothetical protein